MSASSVLGLGALGELVLGSNDTGLEPLVFTEVVIGQTVSIDREINVRLFTNVTPTQIVTVRQAVINISITTPVNINQFAGRSIDATADTTVTIDQFAIRTHSETVQTDVIVDQSAVGSLESPNVTMLTIGQIVQASVERAREITTEVDLGQFAFAIVIKPGITCLYAPALSAQSPMPATQPTLTRQNYITLTYPYDTPTFTVNLRAPKYGDECRLATTWVRERSRSGDLLAYSDPSWPKTEVVSIQFEALSEAQATDLLAMMHESLGQEIGYLDYEGRQRRAIITTPTNEILQLGRGCQYSGSLEMQCF